MRYVSRINGTRCRFKSGSAEGPVIEADLSRRRRTGTAVFDPQGTFSPGRVAIIFAAFGDKRRKGGSE